MEVAIEQALFVTVFVSFVPLAAISIGAGAVSLVQAMLQVQEQSIVHLARIGIMAALLLLGGGAAFAEIQRLFFGVISSVAQPVAGLQ
jgi:type III secretory pathway component EscS